MRRTKAFIPLFLFLFIVSTRAQTNAPTRDPKWAQPIKLEGLPNLHKVSDTLYRGAQPTAEGLKELKKMGIRTVVSLTVFDSDTDLLGDTGLAYEHISFKTWHPEQEDIVKFLQIVTDKTKQPVFVHCMHGSDRTGMMCAVYRIIVDGWTKDQAIKEMTEGGFGFHAMWDNLINFIKALDTNEIKKAIRPATKKDATPQDARTQ